VGLDGNGISYSGHSGVYNFKGETLAFSQDKEEIMLVDLDREVLAEYRDRFPAWMDSDEFELKL
jgi:predicted amidohydrolase